MSGLIRRAELFNELAPVQTLAEAYAVIQGMEEVDAAPVRHGRWIKPTGMMPPEHSGHYECSLRGAWAMRPWLKFWKGAILTKHCPECGALMDAKDGNENGKVR